MENKEFLKARNKEEYLKLVARLIIDLRKKGERILWRLTWATSEQVCTNFAILDNKNENADRGNSTQSSEEQKNEVQQGFENGRPHCEFKANATQVCFVFQAVQITSKKKNLTLSSGIIFWRNSKFEKIPNVTKF